MSSMYSSLLAITTISDHGRSCASVFDSSLSVVEVTATRHAVVITRRVINIVIVGREVPTVHVIGIAVAIVIGAIRIIKRKARE